MSPLLRLSSLGVLLVGLAACDSAGAGRFDVTDYTGSAYTGQVRLALVRPDGTGQTVTYNGTARLTTPASGTVVLTVTADAPDQEPLVFNGTHDEDGMRFTLPGTATTFIVNGAGRVSGSGRVDFFGSVLDVTAGGRLTASRVDVQFDVVVAESGSPEAPVGSTATLSFDMNR